MRNLLIVALLTISVIVSGQQAKRFTVKSGYLKTELSGSTIGSKELWWDNYGNKTCEVEKSTTTTKLLGMKSEEKTHTLTVLVDGNYWVRDYEKNTAMKGRIPMYDDTQAMMSNMSEAELKEFADQLIEGFGGQRLGTEKVGSYSCDVYTVMGAKSWIYKGLVLKSETSVMGITVNEHFVDFKPDVAVASSKFVAPADLTYENVQELSAGFYSELEMGNFDDEGDDESYPVNYPFEKFQKVMNGFSYAGYSKGMVTTVEGSHVATFAKGMNILMIAAVSSNNADINEAEEFESLTVNGKKCYYGQTDEEDDGKALIVDYPQYDMYITIVGVPELSKDELVEVSKKLNF